MPEEPVAAPLGVLGGAFDPIHNDHLTLARSARDRLGLAAVLLSPCGRPPHRPPPQAAARDRLAMVKAALAAEERLYADDGEIDADKPSWTVDNLERLRRRFGPHQPLVLLLGADAFLGLASWRRWRRLFDLAHIAVAARCGHSLAPTPPLAAEFAARQGPATALTKSAAGRIHAFDAAAGALSATMVRAALAAGADDEHLARLLPAPVLDYIRRCQLYSN